MMNIRKKIRKRIRSILGFALAMIVMTSLLATFSFAEMSDMLPDGTNIPDTDIGGATSTSPLMPESTIADSTGKSSTSSFETGKDTPPVSIPQTVVGSDSGAIENPNTADDIGSILGVIIAIIVVLAVIMLIIALMPKRATGMAGGGKNSDGKSHDSRNDKNAE